MKILYRKNNNFNFKYLVVKKDKIKESIIEYFKENLEDNIIDIIEMEHVKDISNTEVEIFIKFAIC